MSAARASEIRSPSIASSACSFGAPDLATYLTHAERIELAAILERSEPEAAAYVRDIIAEFPVV